jgi:hypothetical protein
VLREAGGVGESMSPAAVRMRRLRRRRAAERSRLRDPESVTAGEDLLLPAVESSLAALDLGDRDAAAAALARLYAAAIDGLEDQFWALRRYGPLLLRALVSLHATPLSRAMPESSREGKRS